MIQNDHRLGRAARRVEADSAAYDNHFAPLEENKSATVILPLYAIPIPGQAADFAFERGDDGDFTHTRSPGTTLRRGAMLRPRVWSSIPTRVRPCRNWPTSFSFPCAPSRRSRAAPAPTRRLITAPPPRPRRRQQSKAASLSVTAGPRSGPAYRESASASGSLPPECSARRSYLFPERQRVLRHIHEHLPGSIPSPRKRETSS